MAHKIFNADLFNFITTSPTSYHCVDKLSKLYNEAGFTHLKENEKWSIKADTGYYVKRDNGAIIAFTTSANYPEVNDSSSVCFLGAHTDSPSLKIKPSPFSYSAGLGKLGVEVYGGPILSTWFDRNLAIAGRVNYIDNKNHFHTTLYNSSVPVVYIPSLAIHLDRSKKNDNQINAQSHLPLLLLQKEMEEEFDFNGWLLHHLNNKGIQAVEILSHDLFCYDHLPPQYVGKNEEFFNAHRLDNLASCFTGAKAVIDAGEKRKACFFICNDHEEIGSTSLSGADGSFARDVFNRIYTNSEDRQRIKYNSLMISMDNAHATHPNYTDKSDENHIIEMNKGVVIKTNSKLRYATNSVTSGFFKVICKQADVPFQEFVMRSDMPCGSTIGPVTSALFGIKTVDVGIPSLSMHSIRELAGTLDVFHLYKAVLHFISRS